MARSPADGYTLFNGSNTNVTNSVLQSNLAFDFSEDFAPVALIGSMPNILVVNPALGVSNVAELIALAKTKPEQIFLRLRRHRLRAASVRRAIQYDGRDETRARSLSGQRAGHD